MRGATRLGSCYWARTTKIRRCKILRLLEGRPLSASYLQKKLPNALSVIRSLEKKGFVAMEDLEAQRDPLRASSTRLRASWLMSPPEDLKLTKRERELHAFLELHPGTHNLEQLETSVKGASQAARSLARRNLIRLEPEAPTGVFTSEAPPRTLNPHQLQAYQQIEAALRGAAIPDVPARRRHGIRENRSVSEVHRRGDRAGPKRACCWCPRSR